MTTIAPVTTVTAAAVPPVAAAASHPAFGDDGFTFGDFLDIINPLQHIPVVGTIYRAITGDTMEAGSEIAGGALYGGPIGALLSVADVAFTEATGKPIDRTMLAWVGLDGHDDKPPVAVAQNAAPHPPSPSQSAPAPAATALPATQVAALRMGAPQRMFPAATTRIVPLADYARPPLPAATPPAQPAHAPVAAPAPPAPQTPSSSTDGPPATPQPELQGAQALLSALRDSGVDPASAARAAAAYQASLTLQSPIARPADADSATRH